MLLVVREAQGGDPGAVPPVQVFAHPVEALRVSGEGALVADQPPLDPADAGGHQRVRHRLEGRGRRAPGASTKRADRLASPRPTRYTSPRSRPRPSSRAAVSTVGADAGVGPEGVQGRGGRDELESGRRAKALRGVPLVEQRAALEAPNLDAPERVDQAGPLDDPVDGLTRGAPSTGRRGGRRRHDRQHDEEDCGAVVLVLFMPSPRRGARGAARGHDLATPPRPAPPPPP